MSFARFTSRFAGFLGFVGVSAAVGVLATVAITPALAVTSIAANETIGIFEDLPSYLEIGALSQRTNIYATKANGKRKLLASFYDQNRVEVPWEKVSGYAKDAAVAGEDPRFYEHGGIDLPGTLRAVLSNLMKKDVQGGSSITQQYVKNVIIQNTIKDLKTQEEVSAAFREATAPSQARKLREMRLAIGLEKKYSKEQILLGYLNIAHFGGRVYGVEAAANYFFSTSAAKLTLPQSASLMAIVNNPEKFRLDYPDSESNGSANGYATNKDRRDYILDNMLEERMITLGEHDEAVAAPIEPKITEPSTGCQTAKGAAYFCDYVTNLFKNDDFFGDSKTRWQNFVRAGYDVYTTLDPDLQKAAESAVHDNVPAHMAGLHIGGVAVTVQPGTGKILAMTQNTKYSEDPAVLKKPQYSAVNYNTDIDYGGSSGFQPGSTFKLFTLVQWLKEGHGLNEGVDARVRPSWGTFRDSCADGGTVNAGGYSPHNDNNEPGGHWTALYNTMQSMNTGFMAMAKQLDLCGIRKTAEAMGAHRANGDPMQQGPAFVLGTNEIAPLSMATAFATVAAGGMSCQPIAIVKIVKRGGSEIPVPPKSCKRVISADVAATAAYALNRALEGGTGRSSYYALTTFAPMFSKTGTTDDAHATWITGGSSKAVTVAGAFNTQNKGAVSLREMNFPSGYAADARHRIWPRIMSVANAKYGGDPFPEPPANLLRGRTAEVPNVKGLTLDSARAKLEDAGFGFEDGGKRDSDLPVGIVIGTNPSGTTSRGAIVSVYTSNGKLMTVPDAVTASSSFGESRARLGAAGFGDVREACVVDAAGTGKPTAQHPAPGSGAKATTAITVTISKPSC
ncbi:MAG: hypothetical protein JWR33_526 [Naasia sp.]|jgi:membrane peptidoglycan carboxypeptidase|nr:hypothetical protein [Naasia sp.]